MKMKVLILLKLLLGFLLTPFRYITRTKLRNKNDVIKIINIRYPELR